MSYSIDFLAHVRRLLDAPKGYTTGCDARLPWGQPCDWGNGMAVSFSLCGALARTRKDMSHGDYGYYGARDALEALIPASISEFEDTATHDDVIRLLDTAITNLKAAQ